MSVFPDITGHGRPAIAPLIPIERIVIREVADGAGPSHIIPIGAYLLVVDPWDAAIRRYTLADMAAPPLIASMPRSFSPWRTRRDSDVVTLLAEPVGPEENERYDLRPRTAMTIAAAAVATMRAGEPCGFPIEATASHFVDRPLSKGPGAILRFPLGEARFAVVTPIGGAAAEIQAVRHAGSLAGGRTLVWWSEIDGPATHGEQRDYGGRVTASHYVGIVSEAGGKPLTIIQIQSAAYAPLAPGAVIPVPSLLLKPGFEFVAGTTCTGRDMLWVMAAQSNASPTPSFELLGYALDPLADDTRAIVSLVDSDSETCDRNDPAHIGEDPVPATGGPPRAGPRPAWFNAVRSRLHRQIAHRWRYPEGARERPCGGSDRCAVDANDAGALGTGEMFPHAVSDKTEARGAQWMRPRQLIGVNAGAWLRGVPYSIGGFDLADGFAARLDEHYGGCESNPPPIGHIREGLEWPGMDRHYPLGIDCSALVARIFGISVRSTAEMVASKDFVTADGAVFRLPQGPDHGCVEPVRHLHEIRPGDLLLRDGHVVIYSGTMEIDGGRALRVFEASSRTGKVCESVYDATVFDGWWILRLRLQGEGDESRWISGRSGERQDAVATGSSTDAASPPPAASSRIRPPP